MVWRDGLQQEDTSSELIKQGTSVVEGLGKKLTSTLPVQPTGPSAFLSSNTLPLFLLPSITIQTPSRLPTTPLTCASTFAARISLT